MAVLSASFLSAAVTPASAQVTGVNGYLSWADHRIDPTSLSRWNGTTLRNIALAQRVDSEVAYSRDGSKMIFVHTTFNFNGTAHPNEIWQLDADGTHPVRLTHSNDDFNPRWLSDGEIAFTRYPLGIMVMPAEPMAQPTLLDPSTNSFDTDGNGSYVVNGYQSMTVHRPGLSDQTVPADGWSVALSPDTLSLAYVRLIGSRRQLFTYNLLTSTETQLTTTQDADNPAWSPDGKSLSYLNFAGYNAQTVVRTLSTGAAKPVSPLANQLGAANWQPVNRDTVVRLGGNDRLATGIAVSHTFAAGAAGSVVLSRSDSFADALAGGPLAVAKNGPMLLTNPDSLDPRVATEIQRVLGAGSGRTVYLLGGVGALTPAVADAVTALGYPVVRLSGANRYETALSVLTDPNGIGPVDDVYLATGADFPDALSAGAAAGSYNGAVLLTKGGALDPAAAAYLTANRAHQTVVAVGGAAAVAYPSADIVYVGTNRYDTAVKLARGEFPGATDVGVAVGTSFADALSGGALLGSIGAPLVLTTKGGMPAPTATYLAQHGGSIGFVTTFGGIGVIPDVQANAIGHLISLVFDYFPAGLSPAQTKSQRIEHTKALAAAG